MLLWRNAPRIWEAKGYSQQTVADALEEEFGTGQKLGRTALSILVKTQREPCPPEVEQFIREKLPVKEPKRWARFLDTEANETSEDRAPSSELNERQFRESAREAAGEVANTVRAWLETFGTFITFARGAFSLLTGKLDAVASDVLGSLLATDAKLDAASGKLDSAHAKLDSHSGKLQALSNKLDTADAKLDSNGRKLDALLTEVAGIRAVLNGGLHVTGTVLGIVLLVGLMSAGHQIGSDMKRSETASATQLPPVSDTAKGATGATGIEAYLRAVLGSLLDMGKKTEENWIPKNPYPGQKLAKDCDGRLAETPINGGCWVGTDKAPPCELLFRHGDKCYRPASADPTKPVGMLPVASGQPR
ncbi:MAG TPA: hypothetical protein VK447_08345 [Myxococcaceae bacterium]|nr:hypothetical protein [Myxococcaceae bacterium]